MVHTNVKNNNKNQSKNAEKINKNTPNQTKKYKENTENCTEIIPFIEINNNEIHSKDFKIEDQTLLLRAYFAFNKNRKNTLIATPAAIFETWNVEIPENSSGNKYLNSLLKSFKKALKSMEETGEIKLLPLYSYKNIDSIKLKDAFKIQVKDPQVYEKEFTILTEEEVDIVSFIAKEEKISPVKLVNFYIFIKSFMYGIDGYYSISLNRTSKTLHLSRKTISKYLASLEDRCVLIKQKISPIDTDKLFFYRYKLLDNVIKSNNKNAKKDSKNT